MRLYPIVCLLCSLFHPCHGQTDEQMVIIVNSSTSQDSISAKDLKNIFLGKKTRWEDGLKIAPVTVRSGQLHEAFLKTYVRKTRIHYETYWKRVIFTGQGRPPYAAKTMSEVLEHVRNTPGAIGYVAATMRLDKVKVISVL